VLVHGAWHGGWCWRRVADLLEAQGHKVFTPTLTGLGERSHLLGPDINLDTHIADVVNVFRWEGIERAVLCGHSYGGWVISGAVEELESRVSAIVFVDAHLPQNGAAGMETSHHREWIEAALRDGAMGIRKPTAEYFGVNEQDRAWVDDKLTNQPIGVSQQAIRLTGARERVPKKAYVWASQFPSTTFKANFLTKRLPTAGRHTR
jgi:pimeloyl-ACP methyl ester carboxylesterase